MDRQFHIDSENLHVVRVLSAPTNMKIIVLVGVFLLFSCQAYSSLLDPVIENVRHIKATQPAGKVEGMWKKKMLWKPRWIKEWKSSNVLKPIWKKFWGPVIIREWVPIPKPPPNWDLHSNLLLTKPVNPMAPFSDQDKPPTPTVTYLPSATPPPRAYLNEPLKMPFLSYTAPRNVFSLGNHQSLPIINTSNSQTESYRGPSSYGIYSDSTAFDLNPPVEQFTPQQDYSYYRPIGNAYQGSFSISPKPTGHPHNLHGHHHHHHHVPDNHHNHNNDPAKFPPDWNSWKSMLPTSFPFSLAQQASSAVSVVSELQSTTLKTDVEVSSHVPDIQSENNNFIQQAALVSEYHYTETDSKDLSHPVPSSVAHQSQHQRGPISSVPPRPIPAAHLKPSPINHHQNGQRINLPTSHTVPSPTRQIQSPDPRYKNSRFPEQAPAPRSKSTPPPQQSKPFNSKPVNAVLSVQNSITHQRHQIPTPIFPKHKTPENFEIHKLPDFKALPSSIEAFHFIEAAETSNYTFTKSNPVENKTKELNNISISYSKEVPPYITKLAEAVVLQHVRKTNESVSSTTELTVTPSENRITVVLPTTSSSINKTLKAYLADENKSHKSGKVFVVTPVPLKKDES